MIELHVEPRRVLTWEEFVSTKPAFSIALDGYVRGPPAFDASGPYANFDHHEGVNRLATRSSAAQVYVAVLQGLFETFQKDSEPHANVFVNDPDQDVSLAVWLLKNSKLVLQTHNEPVAKRLARLVQLSDLFDTTGGMCKVDLHDSFLQKFAWVFEPYTNERLAGKIPTADAKSMEEIINAVGERVSNYVHGESGRAKIDARYEAVGGGDGWQMIREQGPFARCAFLLGGNQRKSLSDFLGQENSFRIFSGNAFVSVQDAGNGRYVYTLCKTSEFVKFPIEDLYVHLNSIEGTVGNNCWGGSDIIGGSPREGGSRLSPKELETAINDFLRGK